MPHHWCNSFFVQNGKPRLPIDALVATIHPETIAQVVYVYKGSLFVCDKRGAGSTQGYCRSRHPKLLHIQERGIGTDVHGGQKNFTGASDPGLAGPLAGSPYCRV